MIVTLNIVESQSLGNVRPMDNIDALSNTSSYLMLPIFKGPSI